MAEAVAVVGVVANIIQIVSFGSCALKRLEEYQSKLGEIPEAFRHIKAELPILLDTLQETKAAIDAGFIQEKTKKALIPAVEGCKVQIKALDDMITKVLPTLDDSWTKKCKKAIWSLRIEAKVEKITVVVRGYIQTLTYHAAASSSLFKDSSAERTLPCPTPHSTLPFRRDPASLDEGSSYSPTKYPSRHFTGRNEYLQDLVAYFQPRQDDDIPSRRGFLLYGMAGVGKTQICLKFAEKHSNMFWRVFWVDATNQETFKLSLQKVGTDPIAKREGVDGSCDSIIRWLSHARREWLLILDNADGDPAILDAYIPNGRRGNIIITSRNPNLQHLIEPEAAREVGAMEREDAKRLLGKVSGLDETTIKNMDLQLGLIVDELHSIALAIDHAGVAILSAICGPDDYITMLKSHRKSLLANPNFRGASGYNETLYSALSLPATALEERVRRASLETSPEGTAIQLLNMFAFFHNNSIMEETFQKAAQRSHANLPLGASSKKELPMALEFLPIHLLQNDIHGMWNCLMFQEGIRILHSFSLIRREKAQATYSIHPLVHLWSRERLSETQQRETCFSVFAILSASIGAGDGGGSRDVQYCRRIIPHILSFRQAMDDFNITKTYFNDGFASFWHAFFKQGLLKEAEHFASELKIQRTRILGGRDQQTLCATEYLAVTLRENGSEGTLERSNVLLQELYPLRADILGGSHPNTLRSKVLLGWTRLYKGMFKEAEELLHSALQSAHTHLGESHPTTLMAAVQLSSVYNELGDYRQGEKLQRKTLEILQGKFGDENLQTIDAMAELATILTNSGQYGESEALKLRIVDLRTKMLGENHPDTVMACSNLAATYCKQKRWKEAVQLTLNVIQTRVVVLGELSRETLRSRLLLANCYLGQDRLHEAEVQCKRVVEGRISLLGEQHPHTLWSMLKLAYICACQGRLEEAIDLWERTRAIWRDSGNIVENKEPTVQIMHDFALALYRYGQKQKAIILMEEVLELKRKWLRKEQQHPSILASEEALENWAGKFSKNDVSNYTCS